jgi:uncharacterized protein YjbJ (UPF0337 family)
MSTSVANCTELVQLLPQGSHVIETTAYMWLFHASVGITKCMGFFDKLKNKGQATKGDAKQQLGKAIDNQQMQAEGKAASVKGNLKQAGEKVKDAL